MRAIRWFFWLPVAALCGCSAWHEQSFENREALLKSDLMRKGWVPAFLPTSAGRIDITWNVDLNLYRVRLRTDESTFLDSVAKLKVVASAELPVGEDVDPFALKERSTKFHIHCDHANATLASFDAGTAYYWNLPSADVVASICLGGR